MLIDILILFFLRNFPFSIFSFSRLTLRFLLALALAFGFFSFAALIFLLTVAPSTCVCVRVCVFQCVCEPCLLPFVHLHLARFHYEPIVALTVPTGAVHSGLESRNLNRKNCNSFYACIVF